MFSSSRILCLVTTASVSFAGSKNLTDTNLTDSTKLTVIANSTGHSSNNKKEKKINNMC